MECGPAKRWCGGRPMHLQVCLRVRQHWAFASIPTPEILRLLAKFHPRSRLSVSSIALLLPSRMCVLLCWMRAGVVWCRGAFLVDLHWPAPRLEAPAFAGRSREATLRRWTQFALDGRLESGRNRR